MIKYYQLCIDGIDKAGKDVLLSEIDTLSNHKYSINSRGLMSNIAYSIIYNRNYEFDLSEYKNVITIYLTVDKKDWIARCKATKEKDVAEKDYEKHCMAFELACEYMCKNNLSVIECNSSEFTPYMIAKAIIKYLDKINKEVEK